MEFQPREQEALMCLCRRGLWVLPLLIHSPEFTCPGSTGPGSTGPESTGPESTGPGLQPSQPAA